jgi:hypothetical protein
MIHLGIQGALGQRLFSGCRAVRPDQAPLAHRCQPEVDQEGHPVKSGLCVVPSLSSIALIMTDLT